MNFGLELYGGWWLILIYLIFANGLWFIFPRFVQIRFSKVPKIRYISTIYYVSYVLILTFGIFSLFEFVFCFYIGIVLYISGLAVFISSIFYFAINEIELPITTGVYKYSRHPVYFSSFLIWLGIAISTFNIVIFVLALILGFCSYKIALVEEKNCAKQYNGAYKDYSKKAKLIIGRKL